MRLRECLALCATLALLACPGEPLQTCEAEGNCPPPEDSSPPMMYVAPAFGLGFDCVAIGCNTTREVLIENRGGGVLSLFSAQLTAGTSPDFALLADAALPIDLGAGQATTLSVVYRPLDAEKDYGLLRLISAAQPPENAVAGQVELPLQVRQNGDPVLGLLRDGDEPDSLVDLAEEDYLLNFGYVTGGTVGTLDLIVANQTSGNAILELIEVAPGAAFEPAFYISPLEPEQQLINPGEHTRVRLQLLPGTTPADLRLYTAELLVRTSDPVYGEVPVRLFGTAMNVPVLEVMPASIELGSTRFQTPKSAQMVIRNGGGVDLVVVPQLVGGGNVGFALAGDGLTMEPIGPFSQASLEVTLDASTGGAVSGLVRLESNDPLRPQRNVALSGFVEAPLLAVSPDPVAFGTLVQGWSAETVVATVSNVGHGALDISDLRFEVGSSSQFSMIGQPGVPAQLLPNDPPLEVQLSYTAFTLGPAQGLLVLDSNSIDYARTEVELTATGVTCEQGCTLPHATPDCFSGACEVGSCESGWHDADIDGKNGCECREESPEIGTFCSGAHDVGTVNDRSTTRSGNLHNADDVDTYFFYAVDHSNACWPWDNDGEIQVNFTSAPAGVEFCVSMIDHQDSGDGCGMGSEQCGLRTWTFDNTSCGGDDDRDVTVRVRVTPGETPGCAEYTVRFKSSM